MPRPRRRNTSRSSTSETIDLSSSDSDASQNQDPAEENSSSSDDSIVSPGLKRSLQGSSSNKENSASKLTNIDTGLSSDTSEGLSSRQSARRCRRSRKKKKKSSPMRKSPRMRKLSRRGKDNLSSDEDDSVSQHLPKTWRSKRNDDDDEDFVVNSGEESDVGESENDVDDEDSVIVNLKQKSIQTVDSDGIGSAEESSEDERKQPYQSPELKVKRRGHKPRPSPIYDTDTSSSSGDVPTTLSNPELSLSPPALPKCDSLHDAITDEPLPEKHVCFFSPDGSSKQCFMLSTLRKVALTTANKQFRTTLSGKSIEAFLQPPHFRLVMSDDLLDQIASRFGREALDLRSTYYDKKRQQSLLAPFQEPEREEVADESFSEMLNRFMQSNMGSKDVYACPLCYTVSHARIRRIKRPPKIEKDDSEQVRLEKRYTRDFRSDPITILGNMDKDKFQVASLCCSTKVSRIKEHLRKDHSVDTKPIRGNDLYSRFKVRATDGLLQRFIKLTHRRTFQGQLQSYWFEGNNELFVYLLSQLHSADRCREILQDPDHEDFTDAEDYWLPAATFFESFSDDAVGLWDLISAPYHRVDEEDLGDFLGGEEEEDDDDGVAGHRALAMEAERERFEVEHERLLEIYDESDGDNDTDDGNNNNNNEDSADDESAGFASSDDVKNGGVFVDSSSSEDEWTHQIKNRKRASLGSQAEATPRGTKLKRKKGRRLKKIGENVDLTVSSSDDDAELFTPSKHAVLSASSGRKKNVPSSNSTKKQRVLTLDDSDDDSL